MIRQEFACEETGETVATFRCSCWGLKAFSQGRRRLERKLNAQCCEVRANEPGQSALGALGSKASRSPLETSRSPRSLALRSLRRRFLPVAPLLHSEPPVASIATARTTTTARAASSMPQAHPRAASPTHRADRHRHTPAKTLRFVNGAGHSASLPDGEQGHQDRRKGLVWGIPVLMRGLLPSLFHSEARWFETSRAGHSCRAKLTLPYILDLRPQLCKALGV